MAELTRVMAMRQNKLAEELAAVPGLVVVQPNGNRLAQFTLDRNAAGDGVRVVYPDAVAASAITAVLDAHDAGTPSAAETEAATQTTAIADVIANIDAGIALVDANGWDGLTAAQRKTIMLRILKFCRAVARRAGG